VDIDLYRDPSVILTNPLSTTNVTDNLTHSVSNIAYVAGDETDWLGGISPATGALALDQLAERLIAIESQTNTWNWAVDSWSNSVAYQITSDDTNFWTWAAETWSNSVARDIDAADTNFWTWAADTWSNSVARQITADDTNQWTWAVNSWSNSPAYGITAADTNFWTWASTTWSNSPAAGITAGDIDNWNNAGTNIYYSWSTEQIPMLEVLDPASTNGNIVTNGTFDTDAEWWDVQNAIWSSGLMVVLPTLTATLTTTNYTEFAVMPGKTYQLMLTANAISSGTATLGGHTLDLSAGTTTNYLHPSVADTNLVLSLVGGVFGSTVDDISLRAVTNGPAYIAGDAHVGGDLLAAGHRIAELEHQHGTLNGVTVGYRWSTDGVTNVLEFYSGTNTIQFRFYDD
jgi:hypothetical protein